jgi:hypothetical protein
MADAQTSEVDANSPKSVWDHGILYADSSSTDEYGRGEPLKFEILILFYVFNPWPVAHRKIKFGTEKN